MSENIAHISFSTYPKEQITKIFFSYAIWIWSNILFVYEITLIFALCCMQIL